MHTDTVRAPVQASPRPSRGLRQLVPWLLALAVATCTQDNVGPSRGGVGYFSFRPVYPMASGVSLSQFGIVADSVHILLTRPVDELVLDTTVAFPADSTELRLALPVELASSPEVLDALIEISAGGVVIFRDSLQVTVKDGAPGSEPPPVVTFDYVGPGSNIASIDVLPGDTTITLGDTLFFTASALDSLAAPVANFYVGWKTSDTLVARVNAAGRLIAPLLRGSVRVVGLTPTGISDTTVVTFAPVPVIITADSGNAQVGVVGDSLGALFVARVKGADSLGISGIPVRFQAVAGGAVRDTVVVTDAQGRARTRAVFDTVATGYTFTATALGTGLPAATFTATATATAATTIAMVGGNAQVDTVAQLLPLPLAVHVTDAFANPVSGAAVVFAPVFGNGTIGDDTVFTDASGNASIGYTLGISIGTDSISATIAGTSASVTFHVTGIADTPTQTQEFGGGNQSVAVNTAYPESLLVRVFDSHDNPVAGATVVWSIFSGQGTLGLDTTLTDTTGSARNTLTAGTLAGPLQVEVRALPIVNGITITNTVTAGAPATMVIASGNGQSGPAGIALPVPPEVIVRDAFSNAVPGVTVDFAVVAGGGTIDSATATTDSLGRANAGLWTPGIAGLNTVQATAAAVPADTLLFDATGLPSGTSKLWTGASTGSWSDANSWSPVGVPGITDNVFIPASAPDPLVGSAATIADLTVENGATLIVDAQLTVSGDAAIDGTVSGSAALTLTGSGTALHGTFTNPQVNVNGTPLLDGATVLSGALTVGSGLLGVNGHPLTVGGDLTVSGTGQLAMTATGDSVDVGGNVIYSSSNPGTGGLTAGTLVIRGDLTQTAGSFSNFAASGAHTVRFAGSAPQSVSFASPGATQARFQNVAFANPAGVTLATDVTALGATSVTAGTVTGTGRTATLGGDLATAYAGWQVATTSFIGAPSVYPDSLPRHVVLAAAWTLTKPFKTDSSLAITNTGVLTLNGNTLRVGGTVTQGGILRMQNTGDTLDVGKLFTVNSGTTGAGDLTGGMIRLHGGFTQSVGSFSNYQPSGSHVTRFEGTSGQSASFGSPGASSSRFQGLELADSVNVTGSIYVAGSVSVLAGGKVQSTGTALLAGDLSDPTNTGWRFATTQLVGSPTTLPDSLVTDLSVQAPWTLAQRTRITGTLAVTSGGQIDLNGDTLLVSGAMTQGGVLLSASPSALLDVGGAFVVNSGTSGTGSLSAGHLVLHQGFAQNVGSFSNFAPGAGFLTTFAGTGGHAMSFGSPGTGNSVFSALEVFDSLSVSGSFTTTGDVMIAPAGRMVGAGTGTLLGGLADSSGLGYRMASTTIPGGQVIPAAMTTNLSLTGPWTLPAGFTLTGNLALTSGADLNTNGHRLYVSGTMVQGGILRMLLPADTVEVNGLLTVNSGTDGTGHMVDGRLLLHAGFTQGVGSFNNFMPSSGHVTEFVGSGGHPLSLSSFSPANSHFQHLIVRDSLAVTGNFAAVGDVTLDPAGRLVGPALGVLLGDLVDSSLAGWRMTNTQFSGKFQSIPSALVTNVTLTDSIALAQNTSVTGNWLLTGAGYIAFSGHGLGVSGNFTQSTRLVMSSTQDSLDVGGLFTVNSGNDGTGDLTAGVLVLRGGFTQAVGSFTNFMADAPHRTRFTGPAARTIDLATPNQAHFGDLAMDASGLITLNSDVHATGALTVAGGPVALAAAAQRLLQVQDLFVDGLALDRVRVEMHGTSNAAQFDNVTFTNIDPALDQLSMELPGLAGDTLKFTNVAFAGTPTTGHYIFVADSVANDAPAVIGFYNSTPLNGALYAGTEGTVGDVAAILWTHLDWVTQPTDATELIPIAPGPQVAAFDPSGTVVTGYTGTVTLGFLANPGGAVLGNNSVAAVAGVATFDSLTLSLAGVGYQLQATSPELGASPGSSLFSIFVPIPAGTTTSFNNGGGDNDWFNAANWTFGVPDSLDNVYILPGQTAAVNAPAQVNRMQVGTGGGVLLNAPLTADSSVDAGNTITGGGQLVARGTGFLSGVAGGLVVTGSYLVPTNDTLIADYINISGATAVLDPGAARIVAIDSLRTEAGGRLDMNNAAAVVAVQGRARFTGGASALVAGTLEVGGDFSQEENVGAFTPAPGFTTLFSGGGTQTASFFSPDTLSDHFGSLVLTGGGTLHLAGTTVPVLGGLDIQGGTVVIDTAALVLGPVTGSTGAFLQGALLQVGSDLGFGGVFGVAHVAFVGTGMTILPQSAPYDTVSVLGTAVLGSGVAANAFWVYGTGQFLMNGHRLDVTGDFGTGQYGRFGMTSPADTLIVGGNFTAGGGSTTGLLTAGLLQVSGNFVQGMYTGGIPVEVVPPIPATDAFKADVGHVTRIVGGALPRLIYFDNPVQPPGSGVLPTDSSSSFGTLELVDGTDTLASVVPVAGTTTVGAATVYGAGTLAAVGKLTVAPTVVSFAPASLYTGGGLDYQAAGGTYAVGETFFFGGDSIPVLPYQWLRVGFAPMALTGDVTASQVTLGGQGEFSTDSYNGLLDLNGHALTTTGDFTATGHALLRMAAAADSLDVGGVFNYAGDDATGLLTDGVIVARGDAYASSNWTDTSFAASGQHRFRMEPAAGTAILGISQGPTKGIAFNRFTIAAGATVNYNQFTDGELIARDTLRIDGTLTQASAGRVAVARGAFVAPGTLTLGELVVHDTYDNTGGTWAFTTTFAGTGQTIPMNSYETLKVHGTATLGGTMGIGNSLWVENGGTLTLGGHRLQMLGSASVLTDGLLEMTAPGDTIDAQYDAVFDGRDSEGALTDGVILANYFTQSATTSTRSFRSTGTRVVLKMQDPSDAGTNVNLATGGAVDSRFSDLVFASGGLGGQVNLWGHAEVQDSLIVEPTATGGFFGQTPGSTIHAINAFVAGGALTMSVDTVDLGGAVNVPASVLGGPVTRFSGTGQAIPDTQSYQRLEVTGTAAPEGGGTITTNEIAVYGAGRLTLGAGQSATTSGDFSTADDGTLEMNGAGASLFVVGNATFAGGSEVGLLSDGTIRLTGNFTQLPGATAVETFTTSGFGTGVQFLGSSGVQQVSIDPGVIGNFRGVGITNPFGIQITGNMVVTDSVGTAGPIVGDSLSQFGNFYLNPGAEVGVKVLKTSGLFSGTPVSYTVGRTHMVVPNSLPNVVFDTLVVNANGVSAFYPLQAGTVIVAASGSAWASGPDGVLDLGAYSAPVNHTITGDLRVEGTGAQLRIAEDTVNVGGDFYTSLGGTLLMNGPGALNVSGSTLFGGGSQIGLLTSGTLSVLSGITQQAFSSPSSFRMDGTTLDLPVGPVHVMSFATPDSSWLPDLNNGAAGTMALAIVGRARVAGGVSGYGVSLGGDSLWIDGMLTGGPGGVTANIAELRVGELDQFGNFSGIGTFVVGTGHITGAGALPFNLDPIFDSLFVHDSVQGQLSQIIATKYLEVTGPGNPRNLTGVAGRFYLIGGDGNTQVNVNGDVVVRGTGAAIVNNEGYLQATGDLTVDQKAYLAANGSFSGGNFDIDGSVVFDGVSTRDSLVQGSLMIGGKFTQLASTSGESFAPDSLFTTQFKFAGTHNVSFATPSPAGGGGSHFGGLSFSADAGLVMETDTDLWVEGILGTQSYSIPVLRNTAPVLRTITAQDVAIQGVTFDHLQLHVAKTTGPAAAAGSMDIVNFTNFLTTEDQFLVDLPGLAAGNFLWSNFTFTQLDTVGTDPGHYVVATDNDGAIPVALTISLGTNQNTVGDQQYFLGLNGAILSPFAP